MLYLVNEDRGLNEAIIHEEDACLYTRVREKKPKNGEWYEHIKSREEAWGIAKATGRRDVRECIYCFG